MSDEEAAAIVTDLEQDVHRFLERTSRAPAVVYRACPTGLRVAFRDGPTGGAGPDGLTRSPGRHDVCSVEHATEHLVLSGLRFLFFVDPDGDARLLHRDEADGVVLVDVADATARTD